MSSAGFFGKLASRGDFVSRGLRPDQVEAWDHWLAAGMAASREQLGEDWLNSYLVSPLWCFAIPAGLLGEQALAGAMMPSVDRVGRYFPLSILHSLPADSDLSDLLDGAAGWFEQAAALLLSTLEENADFDAFEAGVATLPALLCAPQPLWQSLASGAQFSAQVSPRAFAAQAAAGRSLWWGKGSQRVPAGLLSYAGLPAATDFAACLFGEPAATAQWSI
jgi:type VI secretion system protein ImpM